MNCVGNNSAMWVGRGLEQGDEQLNSRGHEDQTRPRYYQEEADARLHPHVVLTPNRSEQLVDCIDP